MMKFKQNVKAGTLLLKEEPFVYVLSSKYRIENCDNCLKSGELLKCSSCKYVYYCNKVCQKEAWSMHKRECPLMKKIFPRIIPDAARLLSRIVLRLKYGGDQVKSFYSENKFRMFKDLMSHYSDLKKDNKKIFHFIMLYGVLHEYMGDSLLPNKAELRGMYGRMYINSFNICDKELKSIGTAIYLGASIIDHSCDPNTVTVFDGTTIFIRTIREIENFDWSKVLITYIDVLNLTKVRQDELLETYYFLCQCPKCLDDKCPNEMLHVICPNKSCATSMSAKDFDNDKTEQICEKCSTNLTEFVQTYKEILEFTELQLQKMKSVNYLDACKVCLSKQKGIFDKMHIYHIKILDRAFECCIDFGHFEEAAEYGAELEEGYLKYYGKYHPLVTVLYMKLAKIFAYELGVDMARMYLKKAAEVIGITHGSNMRLYKEEFLTLLELSQYW